MEKEIKLKTRDGHTVYGVLNEPKKKPGKIIIFVHGLAGQVNDHQFFNAAKFFSKKNIATLRVQMWNAKDGRHFESTSLSTYRLDVERILRWAKKNKYRKIYLVGHSLGGYGVLSMNHPEVTATVLWDPSAPKEVKEHNNNLIKKIYSYNSSLKSYLLNWGIRIIMGKKMYEEWQQNPDPISTLIRSVRIPTKVICAGEGILHQHWKKNMEHF
jgi:predicted alpha/beta-fold hydrolase